MSGEARPPHSSRRTGPGRTADDPGRIRIAIVVFDGMDEMDALGPYEVLRNAAQFGAGIDVTLAASTSQDQPLVGAHGLVFHAQSPIGPADGLLVPGGGWNTPAPAGVRAQVEAGVLTDLIAAQAPRCRWVASVCTGAMLLASAGLLRGREATTHHDAIGDLRAAGAEVIEGARVVDAGSVLTSAGVTAGLDLALWLVEREVGTPYAEMVASEMEYQRGEIHQSEAATKTSSIPGAHA